jgi:hypothetical protein
VLIDSAFRKAWMPLTSSQSLVVPETNIFNHFILLDHSSKGDDSSLSDRTLSELQTAERHVVGQGFWSASDSKLVLVLLAPWQSQ